MTHAPHPIAARRTIGGYSQEGARQYRLIHDPTGLFLGGWFTRHDLYGDNGKPQSWVVAGMVFSHADGRVVVVERDRTLASVTGAEAEEIREVVYGL